MTSVMDLVVTLDNGILDIVWVVVLALSLLCDVFQKVFISKSHSRLASDTR